MLAALLALRRAEPALRLGAYHPFAATEGLLAYERRLGTGRLLIVLNMSARPEPINAPPGQIVLTTQGESLGTHDGGLLAVAAHQGLILRLA